MKNHERQKSSSQISAQALRLIDMAIAADPFANAVSYEERANSPFRGRMLRRMEKIINISRRYNLNIAHYFGREDGYIGNNNVEKEVSQSVYMGEKYPGKSLASIFTDMAALTDGFVASISRVTNL